MKTHLFCASAAFLLGVLFLVNGPSDESPESFLSPESPEMSLTSFTLSAYWSATELTEKLHLIDPNFLDDDSVRLLVTSGRLCAVIGHRWDVDHNDGLDQYETITDPNVLGYGYYGYQDRTCSICGKCESRHWSPWK